jgi:hypothetical protein
MVKLTTMRRLIIIGFALWGSLQAASGLQAFPALVYEGGPGIYAPLGGWTKTLGAGPVLDLKVVHPWRSRMAIGAGVGFLQLRGKADQDLIYEGVPVTLRAGYKLLTMRSDQEIWAWVGGGVLRSQVVLSGGKETTTDPLTEVGLSGSVPVADRLRIAVEAKYDQVFATKQDGRGVSFSLGLRYGK